MENSMTNQGVITGVDRTTRIRELNDALRQTGTGGAIFVTNGVAAQGPKVGRAVYQAVEQFADFTKDNDPHGEHDCAVLDVSGLHIIWQIDYYDRTRMFLSEDPADPKQTCRVLTIMLADEY
jgi:hypothetical protein